MSLVSGPLSARNFALRSRLAKPRAYFGAIKLTQITDTVYYAGGQKAQGTLLISWPAFTTATQNVVAAGSMTVKLGADGLFSAALASTTGSNPAGVYYSVVYQLTDGSTRQEYWAVPATDNTSIAAVRAKLVPSTQAAQFMTRDLADTSYVHANDDQTVGGVKTFTQSPAAPDPHKPTDVANKEYVDANAGSANLDSPPPIGNVKPNTVIGSTVASSAGPAGDNNFNALRFLVQSDGEADVDFLKKDGSLDMENGRTFAFLPWMSMPNFPTGVWMIRHPVNLFQQVGGPVVLGRSAAAQLSDPGPGTCTVTHAGCGDGSGIDYRLRFVDANGGYSLPSPACTDSKGYSYAQLVAGNGACKNHVSYHQPYVGAFYSNMIVSRGDDPYGSVVLDPNGPSQGVYSTLSACGLNTACTWDDDGSWGNTSLPALVGAFVNSPERNTTASQVIQGRQWLQGGQNVAGGAVYEGRVATTPMADPAAPTVHANTTGSTSYTYYVVFHDYGLGVTNVSPAATISNGAASPNNSISVNCYSAYSSWDLLKGDTSHALATNLPCEGAFDGQNRQPYVFTDTGQSTVAYSAPGRNSTADISIHGGLQAAADGSGSTFYGPLWAWEVLAVSAPFTGGVLKLTAGDGSHTGCVDWLLPGGTKTFHMGCDSGNDLTLTSDNGGKVKIAGSADVSGDLTVRDIPGHAYFVSKYPSIQAAINAAYGSGTVAGEVIDDRTSAYSGAGFYIPDSVTVRLAPVPYSFTSAVTHNNGNNNVTAAIVVEQGAHLAGGGTSSNHGTTITVGSGFGNDIVATSSVGTGTGAGVQWWHWGAIENLNIDGTNQTAGECLHVENMGETSRVRDLLVKNCYGNNIEFSGAAATQSDINNLTSNRSRNGSGVRFTNLSGLGKINGLSGDCNAGSLASVQENAAGTLVITGLKSEAESSICANGAAHDPVVLLDTLAGLNTHVHIAGGYAFGTAQNAIAKVVGSGAGIVELEGFYSIGYTNLLNDTIRSVVVPATNASSKQPFYYEPNGIVFANQAFTLTPGTGVMGGSTALTPIFYATTGNATMLAPIGNGDSQSIMTGGVQLAGQNRTNYGATPELMARAGYRFTGSGYDTTKWDLVPAWNAGDTTEKNLGNSLTVCQKNGSVSCRWNHVYGANVDALVFTLGTYTVATLPGSYGVGSVAWVNDGTSTSDCTAGHGFTRVLCYYTGSAWTALTTGGGSAAWGAITGTLSSQSDLQTALNGKAASNAATTVNGVNCALGASCAPGVHLVSGTLAGPQSGIVGNGADQSVFSVTIPANTTVAGGGIKCYARFSKLSTSNSITFKWVLGSTTLATQSVTSGSTNWMAELEVFTPSSLSSEVANAGALIAGTTIQAGPQVGLTASENLANASTLKLTFNASNAETLTPKVFYCTTVQ